MIIIIGAGLAGLSAAWKLTQAGRRDFIILEAQDRIGGRIQSIYQTDGCRLDLGAQWLHGREENPIYKWLTALDCIEGSEDEEVEFEGLFVTQTGKPVSRLLVSKVLEILLEAKMQLYKLSHLVRRDKQCKPVDVFRSCVERATCMTPLLQSANKHLINAVEQWFELYEMIDNSCDKLESLSIKAYSEWSDFDGGQMCKLKGGWQRVVDILVNCIGREKVLTSSAVRQIDYSNEDKILIKLANGTCLQSDHVILTVSLGVLKGANKQDFFKPPLKQARARLIELSGFGPANKIFLEFERPYLREERGVKILKLPGEGSDKDWPNWVKYLTGFDLVNGAPDCLLAWIGGEGAVEMESYSDQQVSDTCLRLLQTCLPQNKQPPRLVSITRSNWCLNPFTMGAYSFQSVAVEDQNVTGLWEPLYCRDKSNPKVLFAGEATARGVYATAHGAILSGWREADRLLNLSKSNNQS